MIAGRRKGIEVAVNEKGSVERNMNAERIVPCIQGIVRDMTEPQHALHVVDYYLWHAMKDDWELAHMACFHWAVCREEYLDEREIERDRKENW